MRRIASALLVLLLLVSGISVSANEWKREWQKLEGGVVDMELVEVLGPYAFFHWRGTFGKMPVFSFLSDDQNRIDAFAALRKDERGAPWSESNSPLWRSLRREAFQAVDGRRADFDPGDAAEPDFYVFYFGASWCGPCHRFMPELSTWYAKNRAKHANFEVFFVSWDRTQREQLDYYAESGMAFPLLKLGADKRVRAFARIRPPGIPCLIVLNREGHPLLHTYRGSDYRGPSAVLRELDELLDWANPGIPESVEPLHRQAIEEAFRQRGYGESLLPKFFHGTLSGELFGRFGVDVLKVVLEISAEGRVTGVEMDLEAEASDREALEAVLRGWLFIPASLGADPTSARVVVPLRADRHGG